LRRAGIRRGWPPTLGGEGDSAFLRPHVTDRRRPSDPDSKVVRRPSPLTGTAERHRRIDCGIAGSPCRANRDPNAHRVPDVADPRCHRYRNLSRAATTTDVWNSMDRDGGSSQTRSTHWPGSASTQEESGRREPNSTSGRPQPPPCSFVAHRLSRAEGRCCNVPSVIEAACRAHPHACSPAGGGPEGGTRRAVTRA